jgi:hypothetical protein
MTIYRVMGIVSFLCAVLVIIAMLTNHHIFWLFVDIFVILVCLGNGILLFRTK